MTTLHLIVVGVIAAGAAAVLGPVASEQVIVLGALGLGSTVGWLSGGHRSSHRRLM